MDEEKLYKEYLKSVFYPVNETYFYNVNTRELIPDHLALDNISNYDLNYIIRCMYDIYDMFGRPINNSLSDEIFLSSIDDYLLTKQRNSKRTFKVYDGQGKLITVFKSKPDSKEIYLPYLVQEKDEIVLKDHVGGTIIAHFEIKNKINKVNIKDKENVNRIFQVFGIPKSFKQELKSNSKLKNVYYNDKFLIITAAFKSSESAIMLMYYGNSTYQNRIICYDKQGFDAKFNNERCLIKTDSLNYYNSNGIKIAEYKYVDKKDVIAIDYLLANLLKRQNLTLKLENYNVIGYINNKKYLIVENFKCGRLLVQDEQGLYGYLDENGNEIIKPKFKSATHFINGWAVMDGRTADLDGHAYEGMSLLKILKDSDQYISLHNINYEYAGEFSENSFIKNLWVYDYTNYLKVLPSKNNPFKKVVYYYVDYKTKTVAKTDYEPLRQYENFLFFYISKNFYWQDGYYIFDKNNNSYKWFASKDTEIKFYDNYFICNNLTYYVADQIICLGDFNIENRKLKKDYTLLSKKEYLSKYQKIIAKNRVETTEVINQKINEYQQYIQKIAWYQRQIDELEKQKCELIFKMNVIPRHTIETPSNFHYEENGIKYISKKYVNYLKLFDLLTFDFSGFDVSNLDFTGTNASINPQTVYNKDMSNGNYSDVTFITYDFSEVDITNATFNNDFVTCYQESKLKRKK